MTFDQLHLQFGPFLERNRFIHQKTHRGGMGQAVDYASCGLKLRILLDRGYFEVELGPAGTEEWTSCPFVRAWVLGAASMGVNDEVTPESSEQAVLVDLKF